MRTTDLIGKTIDRVFIDGYRVFIVFTDGVTLDYDASDGGYSCWEIYESEEAGNETD